MRSDFVVIGGGLCGLSAAWALTRRGHEVMLLDQAPHGHADGGSHGSCRIFRLGYESAAYVRLARQARQTWTELEEACGQRLLEPTPQITSGPLMSQVQAAMDEAGAHAELLAQAEAAERFPGVTVTGPVLFEPDSAVIRADRALAALAALSGVAGDRDEIRVTALAEHGPGVRSGVRISTTAGQIDADRVIVCAGPQTPKLAASAGITVPGSANLEQVAYLNPASAGARTAAMPIFIHYGGEFPYGLPVPDSDRYKLGLHHSGPGVDPENQDHAEDAGLTERIKQAAISFLPGCDPSPVATERCVYDNTPDTDFIIDRIGNVVLGSGTSGHGFKFGPLIGEWLAALATGRDGAGPAGLPPATFSISRF